MVEVNVHAVCVHVHRTPTGSSQEHTASVKTGHAPRTRRATCAAGTARASAVNALAILDGAKKLAIVTWRSNRVYHRSMVKYVQGTVNVTVESVHVILSSQEMHCTLANFVRMTQRRAEARIVHRRLKTIYIVKQI